LDIQPFKIAISDASIDDLKQRLARTRWLETIDCLGWREGTDAAFLKRLVSYWQHTFDWRRQETKLNQLPQFTAQIDQQRVHFVHQKGCGPAPMPLVLTHGWPGSFVEMAEIVPMLADPARYGGDPYDAFDVVVPSLPGYGFSSAPTQTGIGSAQTADYWAKLMRGLGYEKFAAQGGDIGAGVSSWLARNYPERIIGVHLNFIPGSYRPYLGEGATPVCAEEQDFLDKVSAWAASEGAYGHQQGTRPQSLAVGLNDSPAGLAAWITEKFQAWSDCHGDLEQGIGLDALLTDISVYWFTQSIGSSFRMYVEGRAMPLSFSQGQHVQPPLGVALFPAELPMPPRSWVERSFSVQRWTTMSRGGHFAALEYPEDLAKEIRDFFRPLRENAR